MFIAHSDLFSLSASLSVYEKYAMCFANCDISWLLLQVAEEQWDPSVVWLCLLRVSCPGETVSIYFAAFHIFIIYTIGWLSHCSCVSTFSVYSVATSGSVVQLFQDILFIIPTPKTQFITIKLCFYCFCVIYQFDKLSAEIKNKN